MSFISFAFLLFLPIVFFIYWALQRHLRIQNLWLVIASYVFYGWWDYRFLLLIIITSCSSYGSALLITHSHRTKKNKLILWLAISLNIGILGCFKYYNFFVDSLQSMASSIGINLYLPELSIILPVGISFYTFQSLGYVIDVYRGKVQATNDFVAFLAFVSFFPQLVAGPIERVTNLLPQILLKRSFDRAFAIDGLRQALWGFFKKMVIADNCAVCVNQVWDSWQSASGTMLLVGMFLFAFQIYCDFSGYSDIAIGVSKLFGIRLCDNFQTPYLSRNVSEFWRRWHISLMTWFRDYVYIPLGGNRNTRSMTIRNVMIVFLLSGLWHGANWTYVMWGIYHGLLLIGYLLLRTTKRDHRQPATLRQLPSIFFTFIFVCVGWVIFRSETVTGALGFILRMIKLLPTVTIHEVVSGKMAIVLCIMLVLVEWSTRRMRYPLDFSLSGFFRQPICRWLIYYILLLSILFFHGQEQMFIYFQF